MDILSSLSSRDQPNYKQRCPPYYRTLFRHWRQLGNKRNGYQQISPQSLSLSLCKFGPKRLCLRVVVITKIGFYIKIEVRSSKLRCKGILLAIIILSITALKIRDILIYFLVPFILYIVCRPASRFTVYKTLFALITVLTVRGVILLVKGVVLLVRGVVSLVNIE